MVCAPACCRRALELWPDKSLWINFPSSVHLESIAGIEATTRYLIQLAILPIY
jgi:hypothetical protein